MSFKPYVAELLATFVLTLFVALAAVMPQAYSTAFVAPVVVALFVYSIGWISGAHLNPAVTVGLASIKKIGVAEAVHYILAQLFGAILAMVVCKLLTGELPHVGGQESIRVALGEAMGAFLLVWAIMSVVEGKTPAAASGLAIGFGLMLGIFLAATIGTNGVLNPAVALGIGSFSVSYMLGPILGGVAAAWAYRMLVETPHARPAHHEQPAQL